MTDQQQELFDWNMDLAKRAAGAFPIIGEDEAFTRQEALVGLRKAVLAYDSAEGRFEPFAWQVIKNHLFSAYRRTRHRQAELPTLDENCDGSPDTDTWKDRIPDQKPNPAREAERSEIRRALQVGLSTLTPSQRSVLEQYAKGTSFAEIARETGTSEQAVRQMFQRGVSQMRPHLLSIGMSGAHFLPSARNSNHPLPSTCSMEQKAKSKPDKFDPANVVFLGVVLAVLAVSLLWCRGIEASPGPARFGHWNSDGPHDRPLRFA